MFLLAVVSAAVVGFVLGVAATSVAHLGAMHGYRGGERLRRRWHDALLDLELNEDRRTVIPRMTRAETMARRRPPICQPYRLKKTSAVSPGHSGASSTPLSASDSEKISAQQRGC